MVLVALKRSTSELSSYQKKIYPVDDHVGISIAGLTADGRLLCKFMRTECLNSRYVFDLPLPISRLVSSVGDSILCAISDRCTHDLKVVEFFFNAKYRNATLYTSVWQTTLWCRDACGWL